MRHILREIFERYLDSEQAAFDASPRELWPIDRYAFGARPAGGGSGVAGKGREPDRRHVVYGELEYRN